MSYSYTDSTKVKEEIRGTTNFSSATTPTLNTVNRWITEVSALINRESGDIFGETTYSETIDYSGEDIIALSHSPIISVSSLLYATAILGTSSYNLASTAVEGTDYSAYNDSGEILILQSYTGKKGQKAMQINYTAGYETIPLEVQALATKMVAMKVLNSLLQNNVNEANSGGSVSVGSISIVEPADISVGTYNTLKSDINELKKTITSGYKTLRYPNRELQW